MTRRNRTLASGVRKGVAALILALVPAPGPAAQETPPGEGEEGLSGRIDGGPGMTVRPGSGYNRVEGLPVHFGPTFTSGGAAPLDIEALAIWRSVSGLDPGGDDVGWVVRLEQGLPGGRFSLGATAYSVVDPVERRGLSDLESSLATFLVHEDPRDHLRRDGWSAFLRARGRSMPLDVRVEYLDEEHGFAAVAGPWSLTDDDAAWRPQPLVAEGRLRSVVASATLDRRIPRDGRSPGWWARTRVRVGLGGDLAVPGHGMPGRSVGVPRRPVDSRPLAGRLDLRRYQRVGGTSVLALRGLVAGSLDGDPLPPQLEHALGGRGSLPAFPVLGVDCGARDRGLRLTENDGGATPAFPTYGCDRVALLQAELRGGFGVTIDVWDEEDEGDGGWEWDREMEVRPHWAVFVNAGGGWAGGTASDRARIDETARVDAGAGVGLGGSGLYLAVPLAGPGGGVGLLVRIGRRF